MSSVTAKAKLFRPRGVEENGLKYYQQQDGDYLCVDPESASYNPGLLEGRATAIGGLMSSVCTTQISLVYLRTKCNRVRRADVPAEWLEVLG